MQLDKRGPGPGAVLETLLDPANATVGCVITLAARGWPVGGGRRILHCLFEDALHIHKKVEDTAQAWKWLPYVFLHQNKQLDRRIQEKEVGRILNDNDNDDDDDDDDNAPTDFKT